MGIVIPPIPPEYGTPCIQCDIDHGGPDPVGKTPKYRYVTFSGIQKSSYFPGARTPPNSVPFLLEQGWPCLWGYEGDIWCVTYCSYDAEYHTSWLALEAKPLYDLYFFTSYEIQPKCLKTFDSTIGEKDAPGWGGTGRVDTTEEFAAIAAMLNIQPSETLFAEVFPIDTERAVYRFANQAESTRAKILYQPALAEPTEYGVDCPICTPGTWPANKTPLHLFVKFQNIKWCTGGSEGIPNDRIFVLTQLEGFPCWWEIVTEDGFDVILHITAGTSTCQLIDTNTMTDLFTSTAPSPCIFTFTNDLTCPGGAMVHDGIADAWW